MTDQTERLTQPFAEGTERLEDETERFEDQTEQFEGETERMEDETERLDPEQLNTEGSGTERLETEQSGEEDEEAVEETQRLDSSNSPDLVETYVRFGPGVPVPAAAAPDRATAIWRGELRPLGTEDQSAARRSKRWVLPVTVLILVIAVLIYFLWARKTTAVAVRAVAVKAATASVTCGQTERLNAVITTNGGSGTLTYQWVRSDGTTSDVLTQSMNKGENQTNVALLWNFDGYGTLDATATLHVLSLFFNRARRSALRG